MKFFIVLLLCVPASLWGYQVYRGFTAGQFRRRGYAGWLERSDHPGEFKFASACNLVCFGAIIATMIAILFFTGGR